MHSALWEYLNSFLTLDDIGLGPDGQEVRCPSQASLGFDSDELVGTTEHQLPLRDRVSRTLQPDIPERVRPLSARCLNPTLFSLSPTSGSSASGGFTQQGLTFHSLSVP